MKLTKDNVRDYLNSVLEGSGLHSPIVECDDVLRIRNIIIEAGLNVYPIKYKEGDSIYVYSYYGGRGVIFKCVDYSLFTDDEFLTYILLENEMLSFDNDWLEEEKVINKEIMDARTKYAVGCAKRLLKIPLFIRKIFKAV